MRERYTHTLLVLLFWRTRSKTLPHTLWEPGQQQVGRHFLVTNPQLLGSSIGPIFSEALEISVSNDKERGKLGADTELGQATALPCSSCPSEVVQLRTQGKWASASFIPTFIQIFPDRLLYGQVSSIHWRIKTEQHWWDFCHYKICIWAGRGQ